MGQDKKPDPILSPIAKNRKANCEYLENGKCSRRDYEEICERAKQGKQIMWDDAKGNPTKKPGGLFGFVFDNLYVDIHLVEEIVGLEERLPSWSRNVGHSDRQVLYLSPSIFRISWNDWKTLEITSWREIQTRRIADKSKAELLYKFVGHYDYEIETGEFIFI